MWPRLIVDTVLFHRCTTHTHTHTPLGHEKVKAIDICEWAVLVNTLVEIKLDLIT